MYLQRIVINHLRNLHHLSFEPAPRFNLITGPNASGKTSILEAIYLLSYSRSFRTPRSADLICRGQSSLTISARLWEKTSERRIGIGFRNHQRELKLDGRTINARAELLQLLPVRLIEPYRHALMDETPRNRRRFLDWGVFYFDPAYLPGWRNYRRSLGQRNASLKARDREGAKLWGREVAKYGKIISCSRQDYLQSLQRHFIVAARQLGLGENMELRYLPGWTGEKELQTALSDDLDRDLRHGCTHSGPHRDDFMVYLDGQPVRRCLSRGQMKMLVYALVLSQGQLMRRPGCLLIDDLASELDPDNQALLSDLIVHSKEQIFITATQPNVVAAMLPHVEREFQLMQGQLMTR